MIMKGNKSIIFVCMLSLLIHLGYEPCIAGVEGWTGVNNGLEKGTIRAIAIDPYDTNFIYAGCYSGDFLKSTDGGENWQRLHPSPILHSDGVMEIVIDYQNTNILYIGTNHSGVYKSVDRGENWVNMIEGLGSLVIRTMLIDPMNSDILYAGTYVEGVFKSINGGGDLDFLLSRIII